MSKNGQEKATAQLKLSPTMEAVMAHLRAGGKIVRGFNGGARFEPGSVALRNANENTLQALEKRGLIVEVYPSAFHVPRVEWVLPENVPPRRTGPLVTFPQLEEASARADAAELALVTARTALETARNGFSEIATGQIVGEPNNHRDTLFIVRRKAQEHEKACTSALDRLAPAGKAAARTAEAGA